MKRDDILDILCKLKYCSDEYKMIKTNFIYEFSGRKYDITFEREKGKLVTFQLEDIGEVLNEVC